MKAQVVQNARSHFSDFIHLVRPILQDSYGLRGTITDKRLFVCKSGSDDFWAMIVVIAVTGSLHAVLLPIFETIDAVYSYLKFISDDNESIEVHPCKFDYGKWKINPESTQLHWPKSGITFE